MLDYGPNSEEVAAFIDLLPALTIQQWEWARDAGLDDTTRAEREAVGDAVSRLALNAGLGYSWDAAETEARWATQRAALAAAWAGGICRDRAEYLEYSPVQQVAWNVARDTAWAAKALVVRHLITIEQFDLLFYPMWVAHVKPYGLRPNRYGPNTAEVEAFIDLLPTMPADLRGKRGGTDLPGLSEEQRLAEIEAHAYAENAMLRAQRVVAWNEAPDAAREARRHEYWAPPFAQALVLRDLITPDQFDHLVFPARAAGIEPDWFLPERYGHNSPEVAAFIDRTRTRTAEQRQHAGSRVFAGWSDEQMAEWQAALDGAREAAWRAQRATQWKAAVDATLTVTNRVSMAWVAEALIVRDLIAPNQFELLIAPMRAAGIDPDQIVSASHGFKSSAIAGRRRTAGIDPALVPKKYGPNTQAVAGFIGLLPTLAAEQVTQAFMAGDSAGWSAERSAAMNAAHSAARKARWSGNRIGACLEAQHAASDAERGEGWSEAWEAWQEAAENDAWEDGASQPKPPHVVMWAVDALVLRDLITPEQFQLLFAPMRAAGIGPDQFL